MTDQEWCGLMKDSPAEARAALVAEYSDLIYVIVLSKLRGIAGHEDIKDCVSDVFVEIFTSSDRFTSQRGSMKNFVTAVAKNTALNAYHRLCSSNSRSVPIDDEDTPLPRSDFDTEREVQGKVSAEHLLELVKALGEPDCSIIIYQYYYDMKVKDIAKRLSMTPESVQKRSIRARNRIRDIIEKEGGIL